MAAGHGSLKRALPMKLLRAIAAAQVTKDCPVAALAATFGRKVVALAESVKLGPRKDVLSRTTTYPLTLSCIPLWHCRCSDARSSLQVW